MGTTALLRPYPARWEHILETQNAFQLSQRTDIVKWHS